MDLETIKAIFLAVTAYIDIPALILGITLASAWYMIRTAQKREDFDFGNMLKDDSGKESATRLAILVAIPFSSWALMYDTIHNKQVDPQTLMIYMLILMLPKVAEKLADAVIAKWSK